MPEPLTVIALLLFGFVAGWVVRSAVPATDGGSEPDAAPSAGRDVAPEENTPAIALAAGPAGAPVAAVPAVTPPEAETQPQPQPAPLSEPAADAAAGEPAAVAAAPRSPDAERAVQATLSAYDDVLDDWLDDRGQMGPSGRASLDAFDSALADLARQDGADEVLAPLRIAGDLIHERRDQPMDAATDAALRGLEQRFRG